MQNRMPDILRLTQVADAPLPKFRNAQFVMVSHESHLDTDIGEAANGRVWFQATG